MTPTIHRILAGLSACAIALSVFAYVASFFGTTVDEMLPWAVIPVLGFMVLFVPIYFLEYPASRRWSWSFKGWARDMPNWVVRCFWLLQLIAIAHFAWSAAQNGLGVPEIVDGQYVLDSSGRILKVLTRTEYLKLRQGMERALATIMISLYFVPMMYWWFWQSHSRPK